MQIFIIIKMIQNNIKNRTRYDYFIILDKKMKYKFQAKENCILTLPLTRSQNRRFPRPYIFHGAFQQSQ